MTQQDKKNDAGTELPRMQDIARRLGISVASVSRALNNRPGVSEDLRQRIVEAVKASMPSAFTTNTNTEGQRVIAFLVHCRDEGFAQDPFYPAILHGLEREAAEAGYHVVLRSTTFEEEAHASHLSIIRDGLALACVIAGMQKPAIVNLWQARFPFVLVDNYIEGVEVDSVETDSIQGAYSATKHLLQHHAYRDVVMIQGPQEWTSIGDRYTGYQKAMWEAGLAPRTIVMDNTNADSGARGMQELLESGLPPRAIIASNDVMALGAMQAARASGWRFPEDIAIVGFDDIMAARLADPPLTTIRVHTEQMGREAARRLILLLNARQEEIPPSMPARLFVRNELVVRRSCGCLS